MAIIYSYPEVTSLQATDRFIISRFPSGSGEISNYNLDLDTLSSYINTGQATIIQVNDRVVTGASFNTGSGLLTLTRNSGDIPSVTTNLDGRYYLSSNPNSYTSNLGVVQSLTTNLTSGAATLIGGVLNIPQYSGGGGITEITTTTPITGGTITTTGTIGITQASSSADGYLSSTDWNTFNSKSTFDGQFSSLSNKPTTIAGYGITDALQLGVTANTALAGNTVIPAAYTNADVDAHLNTSTAGNNEVLSWTGSDYDWVAQSGGGGDTYDLNAGTKSGNSVPLNLTSGSGTDDSLVNLTEGSNVQLTQTSTNEITISSTGGTVTGAWQTLNRTFTGSELVNAFNGNNTDKITLVTVNANEIVSLGICTFICKAGTTGTTSYTNTGTDLYVTPENTVVSWAVKVDNNLLQSSASDQVSQNLPTIARTNTNSGNRTIGANLVLGNPTGLAANITQGNRDFIIQITYRITNF